MGLAIGTGHGDHSLGLCCRVKKQLSSGWMVVEDGHVTEVLFITFSITDHVSATKESDFSEGTI